MTDPNNKQRRNTAPIRNKKFDPEKMLPATPAAAIAAAQAAQAAPDAPARAAPPAEQVDEPTANAIVARGRSVHAPTGRKLSVGSVPLPQTSPIGPPTFTGVTSSECRSYGPGESVTLPLSEIARLRASGFLLSESGEVVIARENVSTSGNGGTLHAAR